MCQTELAELLRPLGAETCVFTGMVTNGVVEGTARDANMREYHVVTLADYVAGYRQDLHEAPLKNLGNIGREEFLRGLRAQP
jgi:ureidoacrylate peracid hydrolase